MRQISVEGYSLVELLIVIAFLAMIAAVATPAFFEDNDEDLDSAATAVATAIRTAQAEAIRTGNAHGVYASQFTRSVRVYRLDESDDITYDVYQPLTKQLYTLEFSTPELTPSIDAVYFKFENTILPRQYLTFAGGSGVPSYTFFGTTRMLDTAYVRLEADGQTRTISVSPMTGRVTVS